MVSTKTLTSDGNRTKDWCYDSIGFDIKIESEGESKKEN